MMGSSSPAAPPKPTAQTWIPVCAKDMVTQGIVPKSHDKAVIMCSTELRRVVGSLKAAFPNNALHGFAIKSNVLKGVLKLLNEEGMGAEAASIGEFTLAKQCFPSEKLIFDSPMKTMQELEIAAYTPGSFLNLDNFQELERVAEMHKKTPVAAHIGLRINPQTAEGSIATLSTGMATSKFGIGMVDYRKELIEAYTSKYKDFLSMIHIHTGSQGVGIPLMVEGVKAIVALAEEINGREGEEHHRQQVKFIDIGGGLPVNFGSPEFKPTFQEYGDALREAVPTLFAKKKRGQEEEEEYRYKILTEFGRAVCAKAGFIASKVEYTKVNGGRRIISQHIGADLAVRTIWAPKEWVLRVNVAVQQAAVHQAVQAPHHHNGPVVQQNGPVQYRKVALVLVALIAFLIWSIEWSAGDKQKSHQPPPFCSCVSNLEDDAYFGPLAEALGHPMLHYTDFLGFWTRSSLSPGDQHQFPSQENFNKFISQFEEQGAKSCVNITHLTPSDAKDQETLLQTLDTLQKPNTCSLVVLETSSKVWPQLDEATDGMASQGIKTYGEMVRSREITYSKEKGTLVLLVHGKVPGHKRASSMLGTLFVPEEEPNKK